MTLPYKSMLSCLAILAMVSGIQTNYKPIQELEGPQLLVKGINLEWGSGTESSQLPIVVYSTEYSSMIFNIYIIQPKKQCDYKATAKGEIKWIGIISIKQFSDNKVVFLWSYQADKYTRRAALVDMNTCDVLQDSFELRIPATNIRLVLVPFADSFDFFTSGNMHASYDANGNLIDHQEFFPINSGHYSIDPVSVKSNTYGFFIADYEKAKLNRVNVKGKILKNVLKSIPAAIFTNNEQSSYSVCWFDIRRVLVRCFQYDEDGNEKWRNQTTLEFRDGALHVKNLAGGRLVFAAWNFQNNQLYVVEMGPKQVNIWSYVAKHSFLTARFMDFNEKDHTFTLAYTPIVQGISEHSFLSQKLSLVS